MWKQIKNYRFIIDFSFIEYRCLLCLFYVKASIEYKIIYIWISTGQTIGHLNLAGLNLELIMQLLLEIRQCCSCSDKNSKNKNICMFASFVSFLFNCEKILKSLYYTDWTTYINKE